MTRHNHILSNNSHCNIQPKMVFVTSLRNDMIPVIK